MTLTTKSIADLVDELIAEIAPEDASLYRPRFNVAPSDLHWIVERRGDERVLVPATWGYLASGRPLINVRSETVASGSGFREAFRSRRCAVVCDGFFEWSAAKKPFWYHRADGGLVLLAGLYQPASEGVGASAKRAQPPATGSVPRPRFTVLTTRPSSLVAQVHDRMPVILARDRLDDWLGGEPTTSVTPLLAPAADGALIVTPVSTFVNSVKNDDPRCLEPPPAGTEDAPKPRQGRLF